jgi:hypothetical protein
MGQASSFKLIAPQASMYLQAARYNLAIGAQGSGKSHDIGVRSALFAIYCPQIIGLIAANTYDQLSRATLFATFEAWKKYFGWSEYDSRKNPQGNFVIGKEPPAHFVPHGHTFKTNNNNIYLHNGAVMFTASLENYTAIEGIEIGWALLDETADTREEAVTSVITGRLRQKGLCVSKTKNGGFFPFCAKTDPNAGTDINPLFVYTKPSKEPWLVEMFDLNAHRESIISSIYGEDDYFYNYDGLRQVVIYSVFHNRENLPTGFIEDRIELLKHTGLIDSHVYGNPFSKMGGEFAHEFNRIKHEVRCSGEVGLPVHFSIDFNSKPYMSGILANLCKVEQEGSEYWAVLRIFSEYALSWPKNTAGNLAEELCIDFGDLLDYGLYVYGDASGNNAIPVKGVVSYFDDFTTNLSRQYELRVPDQNPRYKAALGGNSLGRKAFLNKMLSGAFGVKVEIDPLCKNLLSDLEFVLEDANGAMQKKKNKEGVEERGHHLDALQYLICHPKFLGYLAKNTK